jgi:hypothetical protein
MGEIDAAKKLIAFQCLSGAINSRQTVIFQLKRPNFNALVVRLIGEFFKKYQTRESLFQCLSGAINSGRNSYIEFLTTEFQCLSGAINSFVRSNSGDMVFTFQCLSGAINS